MTDHASHLFAAKSSTFANPGPLGLCSFGMTTILLNLHNGGFFEMNAMIVSMGIFYGGLGQIVAGIIESKKNNTFGLTAFASFGFFWLSLCGLLIMPKLGWAPSAEPNAMGVYLSFWGIFTVLLFFCTLKLSRGLQVVFGSLAILFFLLSAADFLQEPILAHIAGYEGVFCGLSAIYVGIAEVINEVYQREFMPIGKVN